MQASHWSTQRTPRRRRMARGFTLIEAALTTVIVGTGVLAIVSAQQAYFMKNQWAQRTGTAMLLANEMRERTLSLPLHDPITGVATVGPESNEMQPVYDAGFDRDVLKLEDGEVLDYDDLDDYAGLTSSGVGDGLVLCPPINALGKVVPDMENWSQIVTVKNVMPNSIDSSELTYPLGTTEVGTETEVVRVNVVVQYKERVKRNADGTYVDPAPPVTVAEMTWVIAQ